MWLRIHVRRHTGELVIVDAPPNFTATQIAMAAAVALGFGVFDAPWCLGEGEPFIDPDGQELTAWVPMVVPVEALSEETEYTLAVLPASRGALN